MGAIFSLEKKITSRLIIPLNTSFPQTTNYEKWKITKFLSTTQSSKTKFKNKKIEIEMLSLWAKSVVDKKTFGRKIQIRYINTLLKKPYRKITFYDCWGRLANNLSTTVESANVVVSPMSVCPAAILRRMRLMILPDRVFGRPGASWITSGVAIGPILVRTTK